MIPTEMKSFLSATENITIYARRALLIARFKKSFSSMITIWLPDFVAIYIIDGSTFTWQCGENDFVEFRILGRIKTIIYFIKLKTI